MMNLVAIATGGALGALLRYGASNLVYSWTGRAYPWGTLAVTGLGSLLMGFLFVLLVQRWSVPDALRGLILVGLLGGFTTFSTFSMETVNLLLGGRWAAAMLNMLASVVLCVAAAALGVAASRLV
ncbi:MAG: fluoride efflux transporter CrcB [Gammaproteobacteria bacterium]|nr:fluoride efflux transporter CrcB [Gammaproteobacteria bacterium]